MNTDSPVNNLEFVQAMYAPIIDHAEERMLVSSLIDQKTRRRLIIANGALRGDLIMVPVADVVQNPDIYLAPCGKRYVLSGNQLIDPCIDGVPDDPDDIPFSDIIGDVGTLESIDFTEPGYELTEEDIKPFYKITSNWREATIAAEKYGTVRAFIDADDSELSQIFGKRTVGRIRKEREA